MSLPRRRLKEEFLYFCHKHPTITHTCKTTIVLLSTPICCCICCCCWVGYCGRDKGCVKGRYATQKQARMDIVHWGRKAHRLKRRKSLSINAPTTLWARLRKDKISDQAGCPLFTKIPLEIREMIYEYALMDTGAVNWVLRRDWEHRFTVPRAYPCLPINGPPTVDTYKWENAELGASGCSLLRTCRLIYTEATPILYSNNQFRFLDGVSLRAFAAITPTSRLQNIRSLRIDSGSGLDDKEFRAIIRLKCWQNLRVIYIANHSSPDDPFNPFETIVTEAESIRNCVFYFLLYEDPLYLRPPDVTGYGPPKLLSYKYVNPRANPDWRNAEWCTVEEV